MDTGRNAGMRTVGVAWGFRGQAELREHDACFIAQKPEDLLTFAGVEGDK